MTFEMPLLLEQQNGSVDFMQAMLSATSDPSVFQISFDPNVLTSEPHEGLDISCQPLQASTTLDTWLPPYDYNGVCRAYDNQQQADPHHEPPFKYHEVQYQPEQIYPNDIPTQQQTDTFSYNLDYLEGLYSSDSSVGSPSCVSSTSTDPPSTPVCVSPSDDFNFGPQSMAGSWKILTDQDYYCPPESPIHVTDVWGLGVVS